jgi:hemerythrin-like domain-containing protein
MSVSKLLLHKPPAAGCEEPFEMLHACHERVKRTLDLLGRLGEHLQTQGCDAQAKEAAADVQRYFDIAAPLHHEDEELHVFPALQAAGQHLLADTLKAEHEQMAAQWPQIQADLRAVQEQQGFSPRDLAGLSRRWAEFATLYADHIQREDAQAYPIARLQLEEARLTNMARDMARRRGVRISR